MYKTSASPQKPHFNSTMLSNAVLEKIKEENIIDFDPEVALQRLLELNDQYRSLIEGEGELRDKYTETHLARAKKSKVFIFLKSDWYYDWKIGQI